MCTMKRIALLYFIFGSLLLLGAALTQNGSKYNLTEPVKIRLSPWRRLVLGMRRSKFPIVPPRKPERPPSTTVAPTTSTTSTTTSTTEPTTTDISNRIFDLIEFSSSDNSPAVVWPIPRRPVTRRFRSYISTTASPRFLSKLKEKKPTRPAIYSLDGFVPKPSILRISTTEAPAHIVRAYAQQVASKRPKKKNRQSLSEGDEDYDTEYKKRKSSARRVGSARKGVPGKDFPTFDTIPRTTFDCKERPGPGMYADPETGCQVWHMCGGSHMPRHSFVCPKGTIFNSARGVCDWWYNVSCEDTQRRLFD